MNSLNLYVPIFPLPVFLLPQGITRLRIFEARYLKMVGIASKENGFVILFNSLNDDEVVWGSWVDIINFDHGQDGVLEIDVRCRSLVTIQHLDKDEDNLHFAKITPMPHWADTYIDSDTDNKDAVADIADSLNKLFLTNEHLDRLYSEKQLSHSHWVIARWLELLPLDAKVKENFVIKQGYLEAKSFVHTILFAPEKNKSI